MIVQSTCMHPFWFTAGASVKHRCRWPAPGYNKCSACPEIFALGFCLDHAGRSQELQISRWLRHHSPDEACHVIVAKQEAKNTMTFMGSQWACSSICS